MVVGEKVLVRLMKHFDARVKTLLEVVETCRNVMTQISRLPQSFTKSATISKVDETLTLRAGDANKKKIAATLRKRRTEMQMVTEVALSHNPKCSYQPSPFSRRSPQAHYGESRG